MDSIARSRGGGGGGGSSETSDRVINQILSEIDGMGSGKTLFIIGATNRPDLLDNALTRPGRIDRAIYVGVPDRESREKIFELNLKLKSCASDLDIRRISSDEMTQGFSGAEVVAICRDAALLALEESDDPMVTETPKIGMKHMVQAIRGMQRQISPEMLSFYVSYRASRADVE